MRELFIYYQVHLDDVVAARAAVHTMQAELIGAHPQLRARLLHRPDMQGPLQTWMETYSTDRMQDTLGINAELQAEIEARAAGLIALIRGQRHVEVFVTCAS
jgi:hypothetical protein